MTHVHLTALTVIRRAAWFPLASLAIALLLPRTSLCAADGSDNGNAPAAKTPAATVDLFDGMKDGDLDVKFFPRNSREAQILIKNNTDQPLTVKLPDAFAGVPVLAQALGAGANGNTRNTNTNNNNNKNQGLGGGGGGFGGVGGQGGGAFNVPPEKVIKVKVAVVCLDYGKDEPNAHIPYEIKPIESYKSDPEIRELCILLGTGQVDQRSAQAAAWHLANHLTWDELANMKRFPHLPAYTTPYFSPDEIRTAMLAGDQAAKMADAEKPLNPRNSTSPSASSASASPAAP
jgi:hypothetical protein